MLALESQCMKPALAAARTREKAGGSGANRLPELSKGNRAKHEEAEHRDVRR